MVKVFVIACVAVVIVVVAVVELPQCVLWRCILLTIRNPHFKFVSRGWLLAWLLGPRPPENWRHLYSRGDVVVVAVGFSALGRPKGVLAYLKGN